jgi:hypothetical protein
MAAQNAAPTVTLRAGPAHLMLPRTGTPYVCSDGGLELTIIDYVEGGTYPVRFVPA